MFLRRITDPSPCEFFIQNSLAFEGPSLDSPEVTVEARPRGNRKG